ncbi:MAG TPA: DUF4406 domain-containing protein [Paludibacteraceae bacterium]|nr:DUF4406 domain-containing protein [Paludibacteraceae bacterium]HOS37456.1 DUF4406 domain-containing protein [Paludibacteraceae bacterium]HPK20338.1 DUF4406 domain-containing protein [Paludibacteraceae bacterium]
MRKLKIYISGPMSGMPKLNIAAFETIKKALETIGADVYTPHQNGLPKDATYNEHLVRDIELLLSCDAIYQLQGWQESTGAQIEMFIAKRMGLLCFDFNTPLPQFFNYINSFGKRAIND